jgi:histidine triad (HIT) family protein
MECIFCKIIKKEINANILYEDDEIIAFDDVNPKAPVHILIIPKKHIATLNDIHQDDTLLAGKLMKKASDIASDLNIAEAGYRVVMNCNKEGGQEIYHIHLHLLGGKLLTWPAM